MIFNLLTILLCLFSSKYRLSSSCTISSVSSIYISVSESSSYKFRLAGLSVKVGSSLKKSVFSLKIINKDYFKAYYKVFTYNLYSSSKVVLISLIWPIVKPILLSPSVLILGSKIKLIYKALFLDPIKPVLG